MDISRRSFLGGTLSIGATAVLPVVPDRLPVIYGDGAHDDLEGLAALFNHEPVHILAEAVSVSADGVIETRGGPGRIGRTMYLEPGGTVYFDNCRIEWVAGRCVSTWAALWTCGLYIRST
jgi:hypothetical protein